MQKINRSLLITVALVVSCILLAMLLALGIFLIERGQRIISNMPDEMNALGIIFVAICVNAFCVFVLFQVKKADRKLMEKTEETSSIP